MTLELFRQKRNGQRIRRRAIVGENRIIIFEDKEGRAVRTCWQKQSSRAWPIQRLAVDAMNADLLPMRERLFIRAPRRAAIAGGHAHFIAPDSARLPTRIAQEIGGRSQRIGNGIDKIGMAITIAINRQAQIG